MPTNDELHADDQAVRAEIMRLQSEHAQYSPLFGKANCLRPSVLDQIFYPHRP